MAISLKDTLAVLSSEPYRGHLSEAEELVREGLITHLSAVPGIDIREEGYMTHTSRSRVFMLLVGMMLLALALLPWAGEYSVLALFILPLLWLWALDGRRQAFLGLGARHVGTNLVIEREGRALPDGPAKPIVILLAHLDSPSVRLTHWLGLGPRLEALCLAGALLAPALILDSTGAPVPLSLLWSFAAWLVFLAVAVCLPYWLGGYMRGAHHYGGGLAVAVNTAYRLMRRPPLGVDVRLLLASGSDVHHAGLRHYLDSHAEALKVRGAVFLEFGALVGGLTGYAEEAGLLMSRSGKGPLSHILKEARLTPYKIREAACGHVLARAHGFDAAAITDDDKTRLRDSFGALDLDALERAVTVSEALVRAYATEVTDDA